MDDAAPLAQTILDAIPDPLVIKDTNGRFIGCNRAYATYQHQNGPALTGKTVFDILPLEAARRIDQREKDLLQAGGSAAFQETVDYPEGPRQLLVRKITFDHPDGSRAGLVTLVQDITERAAAELALERNQELLATICAHMTDLMAIVDARGKRVYTSPSHSALLGFSPEELEQAAPLAFVHPEDVPRIQDSLATVFGQGIAQTFETRIRHRDGGWLTLEVKANPIRPESGAPAQALIVSRDITARKEAELVHKQLEVHLRHAQKLESIGSLAAGIAHEINTPTQYIGDNTSFLGSALPDLLACLEAQRSFLLDLEARGALPEGGARMLRQIEAQDLDYLMEEMPKAIRQSLEGVARVARIVSAMKDFSHPGGEGKAMADLNKAIESTLTVSHNEWKYVATTETDLEPTLPPVPCYLGEFNQAILNLVVNASHAIEEALGGRSTGKLGLIRIATRHLGREVRISVSDSGCGIPEAIRERIFEPFYTTKPVGKGTGQGLAIVHAVVVEKHGGRVTLETEPGRGTTFHLFLPVADAP